MTNSDGAQVARHQLGSEVRRLRRAAGLTQAALASRAGYSRVYLTLVETGRDSPGEDFVRRLSAALDAGETLLRLYAELHSAQAAVSISTGTFGEDVNRREVLRSMGVVALGATASTSPTLAATLRLAADVSSPPVEHFRQMRKVLIDSDNLFGPGRVIPTAHEQIQILERVRRTTRGADAKALLHIQSQFGEFAAWLHQDKGDHTAARYWTDRALEWSHVARDAELTSFILARKSQLAGDMQDAMTAIEVAEAAAGMAPAGTRLEAVATTYAAHGYALAGDRLASARGYDNALELLAATDVDPASTWGVWLDASYIEVQRARSLVVLGEYETAAEGFENALAELPDGYTRDRGVYLARAALAYAGARDADQATALGIQALAIGADTGSGRIATGLHQLNSIFGTWNTPEVEDFRDTFHSVYQT